MATDNSNLENRARAAFDDLADVPSAQRNNALDRRCGDDATLRERVLALLAAHDAGDGFLHPPPPLFGFDAEAARESHALAGRRIGRYRVIREIASGGMGVVYLAEQDQPHRTVALKVMRAGLADRAMLRRFEHEAEVLGHLQHPGIAQVFEAGTFDDGRGAQPFFAMEYIAGRPITDHAEAQGLDARRRLELLADVCDAVHHAHQKGVVHRDLKPDNILVVEGGRDDADRTAPLPKILDFGVARLVESDIAVATMRTEVGQVVGTLPYMSPEQVLGDLVRVDTRSDVYALGVIAYELLAGRTPLDLRHKSMVEAARIIADDEPPALTHFNRALRGDVSTIVAKALEKDRARRYQSASELAEDIRRYLRNEPIHARPATTLYQLQKFAQRHRALVAGACGVLLMLVLGVVGTSIGLVQARESARIARKQETAAELSAAEAQTQRAAAEQVSRFLQQMLASVSPSTALGRDTTLLREILDNAAQRADRELAGQPDIAATLHGVIGRTYASIAEYAPAIEHLQLALDLRTRVFGATSIEAARAQGDLGRALLSADRFADAQPLLDQALAVAVRVEGEESVAAALARIDAANRLRRAGDYGNAESMLRRANATLGSLLPEDDPARLRAAGDLANVLLTRRKFDQALPLFEHVRDVRARTGSPDSPELALVESNIARTLQYLDRVDLAKEHMTRALVIYRKVLPPDHGTLANALLGMANIHFKMREYDQAEIVLNEALEANRRTYGEESPSVATIIASQSNLAEARNQPVEAERLCLRSLEIRRRVLPPNHPDIATSLRQLASLRAGAGEQEEALPLVREALDIQRQHGAADYDACESIINLATYEYTHGRPEEAERLAREALEIMIRLLGEDHASVLTTKGRVAKFLVAQERHADALSLREDILARMRRLRRYEPVEIAAAADEVGSLLVTLGRFDEAKPLLRESLETRARELGAEHFATGISMTHLGACLTGLRAFEDAEPLLLRGEAIWARQSANAPQTREARQALVALYVAWNRADEALKWRATLPRSRPAPAPASQPTAQPRP